MSNGFSESAFKLNLDSHREPCESVSLSSFLPSSHLGSSSQAYAWPASVCTGVQLSYSATASLALFSLLLSGRGLLVPALASLSSVATLGRCEVRRRDTQGLEVLLLDRR